MINNTRNLSKASIAKDIEDRLNTPEGVSVENTKAFTDVTDVAPATTNNYYESILNPSKPKKDKKESKEGTSNSALSLFSAMADISPDTHNVQAAQSRPFDYTQYGEGTGENLGVVHTDFQMNKGRAQDQSGWSQAKNAIGRVALNVIPEIVSQVANIADIEDYSNSDAEVGNWLNDKMKEVQQGVNEALPIYRENPDTPLDYKDSAWWFENGAELVKSAAAFAAVGYATGGAVSPLFAEAGFMAKFLNPNQLRAGSVLTTASALNQAEGVGVATDTFKQSYDREVLKLQSGENGNLMSPEEIDIQAREVAAIDATSALNFNKINILLNITSAGLFMKTPTSINQLAKKTNLKNTLGTVFLEGSQEYLEENINDISTEQALADEYSFADALEYVGTAKGIESGLLGFVGGAGQTGVTIAGKAIPMYTNHAYNRAYNNSYNNIKTPDITEEEKSAQASREALEKVGNNKSKVSANFLNNQRYIEQQTELARYNTMSEAEKISDVTTVFNNAQEATKLQKEIKLARDNNEESKAQELEQRLFNQQAYQSFETGTVDGFTELYKSYRDLSHDEALERGIYKEGDETKPIYYKKKAQQAIDTINDLGQIYINSSKYINNHQVYDIQEQQYSTKKTIITNKEKLDNLVKQAEENYKHIADIRLGESESTYRDSKKVSGYDVTKFPVKFRFTSAYKQIKSLSKSIDTLQNNVNDLQEISNIITSSNFQEDLSKRIKNRVKVEQQEIKKEKLRERVSKSKLENKQVQTNLESQVINTVENVEEINTSDDLTSLPLNDTEVEILDVEPKLLLKGNNKTVPKTIQDVKFPSFNDAGLDGMLSGLSSRLASYDYYEEDKLKETQDIFDTLSAGRDQFLTSFPLKAKEINLTLESLYNAIEKLKSNIESNNQDQVLAKQNAQALMSSFRDIPTDDSLSEDNAVSNSLNFEKADQQYQLLKTVLNDAFNQGIDQTEGEEEYFRNIVDYLQNLTTKDEVIEYFIPLKNLFNVVTGSNIEGTYQEIMLSPSEKQDTINTLNRIALFSVPKGTYTYDLDNISSTLLSSLNEIAKMQGVTAEDNGMAFSHYNETASNLLAYLVKDYNTNFKAKKDKEGNSYIEVTKKDIDNLLNTMLDQRVLNPNIIKKGTIVEFRGLDSITLQDGSTLYAKDVDYSKKPVAIFVDGSQVEGLYLHDPEWINATNVDNTKAGIEADRAKLLALKKYIIDNPQISHTSTITNRTPGVPILDSTGQVEPVAIRMPEVQVGIIQNGQIRLNRNEVSKAFNTGFKEGQSVTIIPFGSKDIALPAKRSKLNDSYKQSILSALDLYIKGKPTNVTNRLKNEHQIDILTSIGIEQYMNMFINLGRLNARTINEYTLALNTLNDGVVLTQFSNVKGIGTQLLFGEGAGVDAGYISKTKYINKEGDLAEDLAHFKLHLDKLFTHVNLDLLGSDTVVPIIEGEDIIVDHSNYEGFVKRNTLTPYLSIKLEDGTTIYSIQGRIHFDLDSIYDNKIIDENNTSYEVDSKTEVIEEQQFVPFTTPDGRVIDFNEADEDFSPDTEESNEIYSLGGKKLDIDALEKASFSIKGIPLSTQISLIRTISNSIQTEILENPSSTFNVTKQVDLFIQGLQLTKQEALRQQHPKANFISNQVDILSEPNNVKLITNEVRTSLSKKKNVKVSSDNSDEIEIETGDENEKAFEQEFTVDPKVGMTDTIRLWFEGFTEKKIVNGKLRERTNLLGLKSFIPFDESYNDVLGLLAKSNNNTGYINSSVELNRKFDTSNQVQPTYIVNILSKLEEHIEDKPYFEDVIIKLRYAEPHIQNQFNSTFNVTHTNHIFLEDSYNASEKIRDLKPISSSARNVTNLVISEWQNSLRNTGFFLINREKIEVNKEVMKEFKDNYSKLLNKEASISEDSLNNWLKPIGIVLSPQFYNRLNLKGLKQNDVVYDLNDMLTLPNGIFKNIYNRVLLFDSENTNALSLEDSNLYEDSSFKELANLLSYYRKDLFNKAFKNGNGDTVNGFTNAKRVIEQGLKLKSNLQSLLDLKKDVFSQDSTWLNGLLTTNKLDINKEGLMYKYFNYFTVDSFKLKKNQKGKVVDTLKEKELEKLSLALFYNKGLSIGKVGTKLPIHKFLFNTMSDKAAVVGYQAPGRHYSFNQIVDEFGIVQRQEMFDKDKERLVKTLFFPEITRIIKYQDSIGTDNEVNIAEYAQGAGKFLMFPALNNIHTLFEGREIDSDGNIIEQGLLKDSVLTDPIHMVSLKQAMYNHIMSEYKIKEDLWKKFDIISTYNNETKLAYIDNTYSKAYPDADYKNTIFNYVINYMVANMNFQQLFIGDIALYTKGDAISTSDNLGKRLASMSAGQTPYNNYKENFNVLVLADNNQKSTSFKYIQDILIKVHGEKLGRELAKGYENLKASDAQEYTSLEEYVNLMFAEGNISKVNRDSIIEYYNRTGELRKGDYKLVLQPTKPVYTNNFMRDGINSSLYIKSSSIPLIKSLTQGTELDKLREVLDNKNNNIQRIAFKTAVKIGQPKKVLNPFKEDGSIEIPSDFEYSVIRNIPRDGHGVQQAVPYDADNNTVNDGTQQAKEWLTNFMDIDGFINPITGEKGTGRYLNEVYTGLYSKLFTMKHSALVKELAFDVNTGYIGNLARLKKIIIDEGLSRNYNSNDVQSMELNDLENKFTVPLWLNNSDSKIVSLLNSIVDNRVRKRKFRGKSLVLASNTGLQTIEQFKGNDIVTIPGFDGTPKASYNKDGVMTSAEILIPFKFWDNKGKALNLNTFINDEGVIDLTKLPEELLEIFGYRIPTSGVNLMSNLKVVGFLPEGYGDIVIAPADFIEQMGSDFDVDKLYTHMYNTYYDSTTNELIKLNQSYVDRYNTIKQSIKTINNRIQVLEGNGIRSIEDNRKVFELRKRLNGLRNSNIASLNDVEEQLIQNHLLDLHKAVLNNPNVDVQAARVKPLSFGDLPKLAKDFAKGLNNGNFSVLNDSYQKMKYLSARSGKSAVGNFSLNMVFNSVVQQVEKPMNFIEGDNRVVYNIGGQQSNYLNDIKTSNGSKYKSDVIEAFMASALDNENEQLLGKLNINNETFDFIRASAQLGYDENTIITLINQPVIRDYVEKVGLNIPVTIVEYGDKEKLNIKTLDIEGIKDNINTNIINTNEQKSILSLFLSLSIKGKELKTLQSAINSDSSGIGKNMFYSMRKAEQIINLPMKTSVTNANQLIGDYIDLVTNVEYNGLSTTLAKSWLRERIKDGYYKQGQILIKPNTLGGLAGVYGTIFNTQLWSQLYPYTDQSLYNILTSIQEGKQDRKESINEESKELQESVTNYKSLLISNAYDLAGKYNNIYEARQDLLFDSVSHMSLGSIISDLRVSNKYTNPFLDRLQIGRSSVGIDITSRIPTDINYYNASSNEYDEEILLKTVIDMITNPKPLGEYNGESLTTKDLMEKLVTHQFITGGIQKSSQFVKYIPFEYLKQIGYYTDLEVNSALGKSYTGNKAIKDIYRTQTIQHFPESYYNPELENSGNIITDGRLLTAEVIRQDIIVLKDDVSDRFLIFKEDPIIQGDYYQIDNLGSNGLMEWDFNATFAGKSNIYLNQVERRVEPEFINTINREDNIIQEEYIPIEDDEIANFLRIDRSILQDVTPDVYNRETKTLIQKYGLDDTNISIVNKYTSILNDVIENNNNPITVQFAKELLQVVDVISETPLYINTRLQAKGVTFTTNITGEPVRIEINPNKITSDLEMQNVMIEEMTHAVLKQELKNDGSEFVKNITNIREETLQSIFDNDETYQAEIEYYEMKQKVENRLPLKDGRERDLYYSLYNNDEFIAAAITNKNFQSYLNNNEGTNTTKSLWSKFINSIKKLLVKLGVNDNSNLGAVIDNTLSLFKTIDKSLSKTLSVPKYTRTVDWINEKFNLVGNNNELIIKENAEEIAGFIESYIVNVNVQVKDNKVIVESNTLKDLIQDLSTDFEYNSDEGMGGSIKIYLENIQDRINRLSTNITKAEQEHNSTRVAELMERRNLETIRIDEIKGVASVAELADKATQDLDLVNNIMKRSMTSEDINYARSIINFWKEARNNVFQEKHKGSKVLTEMYGAIEGNADVAHDKLFQIEKSYLEGFIKQQFGKDVSIDDIFSKFKDISWDKANLRDISQYDNMLLNSIWAAIKEANINALTEGETKTEQFNISLQKILPKLKQLNSKSPFELFRQLTESGKKTSQLVKPFTHKFYKDRYKEFGNIIKNNNTTSISNYANWISNNGVNTNLEKVFPADRIITDEVTKAREDLRLKLGNGIYNQWFKNQERKLNKYETNKDGYIDYLLGEYKLNKAEDLKTIPEAINRYQFWLKLNSPYILNKVIFTNESFPKDLINFNSQNYFEVVPSDKAYLDNNYQTISNDNDLLEFYDLFNNLVNDLSYYVPESQQKVIAYGGIPSIEKSLFEMYGGGSKGMELGFAPIYNTFIQSMQTSYNESSITATDFATGKPRQDMRIPIIKDNYRTIMDYVSAKEAEYIVREQKSPTSEILKGFEEDIVAQLAEENSFDLGKVAKVYSALVLAHKHKARLQDTINIANNVIGSYQETILRPDGTPLTNRITGQSEKKAEAESFIKTKESFNSYIQNVMYGNIKEEEGKGKTIYTKADKNKQKEIEKLLEELEINYATGSMEDSLYESTKDELENQLSNLGKTLIYSKAGDNVLKYLQLKLMGWNVLGGIGNMGFGWIANQIEGAGGEFFNSKDLTYAYRLTGSSILKNWTFNKVQTDTAKKIRSMMDTMDVLKDSSYELYSDSVKGTLQTKLGFLSPFNISQRAEYLNQAPLMIALFRNTEVETTKGKINLYDGFTQEGKWNTEEYGDVPTELINRTRIKLDKLIVKTHGNYDNLSPIQAKRSFLGRAASQFRNFLFEAYYTRFETERFDPSLDKTVKGRYRSVGTVFSNTNKVKFGTEVLKGILNQMSFGRLGIGDFNRLVNGTTIKEIDAVNMNKVAMEAALAIEVQLFLLLLTGFGKDEDDEDEVFNVLFNQGTRMRTDLLLYINPNEAKNIIKDLIPAMSVIKDSADWFSAVGSFIQGEDTIQAGVHEGNSKLGTTTAKMIPFVSKVYSTYNSTSQAFDKN